MGVWLLRAACIAIVLLSLLGAIAVDLRVNLVGHSRAYRLARLRNWLAVGLVYMLFYQARYAATISNTDDMRERMGVSTAEYGRILTCGFWSYATWCAPRGRITSPCAKPASSSLGAARAQPDSAGMS